MRFFLGCRYQTLFPVAYQRLIFAEHDRYFTDRIILFFKKLLIIGNIDKIEARPASFNERRPLVEPCFLAMGATGETDSNFSFFSATGAAVATDTGEETTASSVV
ncbi:MAG: hypothetical protein WDO16_11555 [Bacteroidota bacterium]